MVPVPSRTALPGMRGSDAARASPRMSVESAALTQRKARRMSMFARICALTAPEGLCVAAMRCSPRLRPCAASRSRTSIESGCVWERTRNSSMATTSRAGARGTEAGASECACSHEARSGKESALSCSSRRCSSAAIPSRARVVAPGSRSVRSACVWGSPCKRANVDPPL